MKKAKKIANESDITLIDEQVTQIFYP